jgi:RNA polymerase sigma factor (sigma-70 family)
MTAEVDRAYLSRMLTRVAARDAAALEDLYARTSAKLFGVTLRVLGDRQEAEDVLQEVYLSVWNKAARFDETRASPITWLAAIARNRAIDRLRSRQSKPSAAPIEAAADVVDPQPLAESLLEGGEAARKLAGCLDQLEPRQAEAVRTAFFEGVTYDALAKRMGVPLGTMKSWIRRSLMSLRGCLES